MKIFGFYIARELPEKIVEVEKIVEKIEYIALGDEVDVYVASAPKECFYPYVAKLIPDWHNNKYLSCNQALEECPKAEVTKIKAYRVGKEFFTYRGIDKIKVQPKPKVPKGKAA